MFKKIIALLKDKPRLHEIVFGSETPAARKFDLMVIIAISVSLIVMFVESLQIVNGYFKLAMEIIEGFLTFFFTAEYIIRLYCSPRKRDYALSFFGVIDFCATIPPYLSLFIPVARYMLVFRAFRFIRVFRIFKLFSFINEGFLLLESIRRSMTKILVYFLFVWILVICIGTLMYILEANSPESAFSDLPTAIYWAIVTMTTVGYGDIVPVTATGRFLAGMVMILGYTIIAVPTGIVSATMVDLTKEAVKDGLCPRCGGKVDENDRFCKHCGEKL